MPSLRDLIIRVWETQRCGPSSGLASPPPSLPTFTEAHLSFTEGLDLEAEIMGPRDSPRQPKLKMRDWSSSLHSVTDLLCDLEQDFPSLIPS